MLGRSAAVTVLCVAGVVNTAVFADGICPTGIIVDNHIYLPIGGGGGFGKR